MSVKVGIAAIILGPKERLDAFVELAKKDPSYIGPEGQVEAEELGRVYGGELGDIIVYPVGMAPLDALTAKKVKTITRDGKVK